MTIAQQLSFCNYCPVLQDNFRNMCTPARFASSPIMMMHPYIGKEWRCRQVKSQQWKKVANMVQTAGYHCKRWCCRAPCRLFQFLMHFLKSGSCGTWKAPSGHLLPGDKVNEIPFVRNTKNPLPREPSAIDAIRILNRITMILLLRRIRKDS